MKIILSVLVGLILQLQLVLVLPHQARAISEDVLIMQLQTAGALTGTSSQELVLLYNSSDVNVNVTNWCISYSSAGNGSVFTKLGCVDPPDPQTELWLAPDGYVSFASSEFVTVNAGFVPDFTFNAGIAATGGHVRLLNQVETEIDRVGWGAAVNPEGLASGAHSLGSVLGRNLLAEALDTDVNLADFSSQTILNPIVSGLFEQEVLIDLCSNIENVQTEYPAGFLGNENGDCFEDFCPNLDELQQVAPIGYEKVAGAYDCTVVALESATLFITELLPNAPSRDTGQEFIELFNPNSRSILLSGYKLQLGPSYTKQFTFTSGAIGPNQYMTFSDLETGITLPNSTGQQLRLLAPDGNTVSESSVYTNADDDVSWALVEDAWIFTNQITPKAANKPYLESAIDEVLGVTSVLAPCPSGKFRNPATNRCKTIETAVSILSACAEDEFRNPETNRCKKLASGSSLMPCGENQERNPETNRCRNTSVLGLSEGDLPTITDIAVKNTEGQINWLVISTALLGTFGYIAYEWRSELQQKLRLIKTQR